MAPASAPPKPAARTPLMRLGFNAASITAADGSFTIEFTAKPDVSVAEKEEPTFQYEISADVTDTTGETRSASRGVVVGYTALQASLAAGDWQTDAKPVEITIATQSLDGEGQKAEEGQDSASHRQACLTRH